MTARITRFGVLAIAALLPLVASAQQLSRFSVDATQGSYVIEDVNGSASCRPATAEEAIEFAKVPRVPLHVFGEHRGIRTLHEGETHGLNIILLGTDQLEANAEAKAAFERAVAIWESRIADPVTIYVRVDYGATRFGEAWPSSTVIASASTPSLIGDEGEFAPFRNFFVARADDETETAVYNALPLSSFATDMGGTTRFFVGINLFRVFQYDTVNWPLTASADDEYKSSIGFNSAFSFDFNPDDGIDAGKTDFVGVVVHEIGHMLGFQSRVGGKETDTTPEDYIVGPAILDFFRFRPGVDLSTFGTGERILTTGGDQVFFGGGGSFGLSTGNPRGENGDQAQASHWKDDTGQFGTGTHIGLMDPTASRARRYELTRSDLEAFDRFGWNINYGSCTELESNDVPETASDLPLSTPCSGTTGLPETSSFNFGNTALVQDVFKVDLPGEAKLNVSLSFSNANANLNVYLVRADRSIITSATGSGTTESFETATLAAGTYYVAISAVTGTSPYTLTVTPIGLKPPVPNAPSSLTATPASSSSIRLAWSDNATNEADFRIERKDGDSFVEIATVGSNTTTFEVPGLAADSTFTFRVRARNEGGDSAYTSEASARTLVAPGACVPSDDTVCLLGDRFRVTIDYLNQFANPPQPGKLRAARLLPGTQNPDTATFGFSSAQAIEVVVRIQDTRPFGLSRFDVYYGGMTDVEYTVTVQDMQTGTTRQYRNPPGKVGADVDRSSFPANGAQTAMYALVNSASAARTPIVAASIAPRACVPGANAVCLLSDRFEVRIDFLNQFANPPAPGSLLGAKLLPGVQNPDTATFGFSSALAIESVVRIQDTRPFGLNRFDIYVGGMSDVEYTVTVTDTQSGRVRQYRNPPGAVGGIVDRASFTTN
jgi:hypothetical protein